MSGIGSDGSIEIATIGAIRLALNAAADEQAALEVIGWLVDQAPDTEPSDTHSPRLLIEAIKARNMSLSVNAPSGGLTE